MKRLKTKVTPVSDGFLNTGIVQFLTNSHDEVYKWIQNYRNSNADFLCRENSEEQSPSQKQFQTEEVIQAWLVFYLSKLLLVKHNDINIYLPFEYYGITSLEVLRLTYAIEVWLGCRLSSNLLYEYRTIKVLAQHLAKEVERIC